MSMRHFVTKISQIRIYVVFQKNVVGWKIENVIIPWKVSGKGKKFDFCKIRNFSCYIIVFYDFYWLTFYNPSRSKSYSFYNVFFFFEKSKNTFKNSTIYGRGIKKYITHIEL